MEWHVDLERWFQIDRRARAAMIAVFLAKGAIESASSQEAYRDAENKVR